MNLQINTSSEEPESLQVNENIFSKSECFPIVQRNKLSRTAPRQLVIPNSQQLFARPFTEKFKLGLFLGSPSTERKSLELEQYRRVRLMALSIFNRNNMSFEPGEKAIERTRQAVKSFFALSYDLLIEKRQSFPLANYNKCLGMVAVPNSNLVMIAISQDKIPAVDEELRKQMVLLINEINLRSPLWKFELACIPTPSQYLIPRTLSKDIHHPAPKEHVDPHTRCVEVALMVALNKIGRYRQFTPSDIGVMAFGGTLWASKDDNNAVGCFEGVARNKKYVEKSSIRIELPNDQSGWIDIWEPCACHCKIYRQEMAAVAVGGGPSTSFTEPCSEWSEPMERVFNY